MDAVVGLFPFLALIKAGLAPHILFYLFTEVKILSGHAFLQSFVPYLTDPELFPPFSGDGQKQRQHKEGSSGGAPSCLAPTSCLSPRLRCPQCGCQQGDRDMAATPCVDAPPQLRARPRRSRLLRPPLAAGAGGPGRRCCPSPLGAAPEGAAGFRSAPVRRRARASP